MTCRYAIPLALGVAVAVLILTALHADAPASPQEISLFFAGDIMLSRSVGDRMEAQRDWSWPFHAVASRTAQFDLAFANLESVISDVGTLQGCGFCFRADPRTIEGLQRAGFDVLSVANNHAWDYGPDAFFDTLTRLEQAGIAPVGGGRTPAQARAPVIRQVHGTRIAYLASTDILPASACAATDRGGVNCYQRDRLMGDIAEARGDADIVIVSFHGGDEYETAHNPVQEQRYRAAVLAGADLVIGHHPHVVQEVEEYIAANGRRGWIAYSLGNFVFDQNWSLATRQGLALEATIRHGEVVRVRHLPVDISTQYQPSFGL